MKKVITIMLAVALVIACFAGCAASTKKDAATTAASQTEAAKDGESEKAKPINLLEKLKALMVTDAKLGLKGKYNSLSEIKDGKIDPDLTGVWAMADGSTTYTYNEDGTAVAESKDYGSSEIKYTCIEINGYKIICEEMKMESEDTEGKTTESTVIGYTAYTIENDALYTVTVEDTTDTNMTSAQSMLVTLYRADEKGSADAAMAKNPIDIASYNGTWTNEKGTITIADGTLTLGKDSYKLSLDKKNQLVVEKDGVSTAYSSGISIRKNYSSGDKTQATETTAFVLSYTGADEKDKPNLASVLDDYKQEYGYETWYYSGGFDLQK